MNNYGVQFDLPTILNELSSRFSSKTGAFSWDKIIFWTIKCILLFYLFFALMIVRQVNLMTHFLGTSLSPWIKTVAWIYALYVAVVLLLVLAAF